MSSLSELKAELAASLELAGWTVKDYIPTNVQPPIVLIDAGDPYVIEGETFDMSEFTLNLQVHVVAKAGHNSRKVADLDRMIEALLPRFAGWSIEVGQPDVLVIQESLYFGCMIRCSHDFNI